MKVLILSVSAGGGHSHAAFALKNYIMQYEPHSEVNILDTIKYINPFLDKVIIGSYLKTIKVSPSLFGKLYRFTEKDDNLASLSNKLNEFMAYKLLPRIQALNPEVIVCTHPFPMEMVSILKTKKDIDIPMVCMLTDYAPHSFWIRPKVDSYVVSNSDMIEEMVQRGVNRDCIHDVGIPIDPNFTKKFDRNETLKQLNLDPNKKTLMIMGGSLGMGKIASIYGQLSTSNIDIQLIVIAGNNKKLYSKLIELQGSAKVETRILGYTKNVNKYMQACDLLLTKPGGLTITEALFCHTPLALFCPIPGQEEKNEGFLLKHNLAVSLNDGSNCTEIISNLIKYPSILESMKNNCEKFSKPSCGKDICNLLSSLIKKNTLKKNETEVKSADFKL